MGKWKVTPKATFEFEVEAETEDEARSLVLNDTLRLKNEMSRKMDQDDFWVGHFPDVEYIPSDEEYALPSKQYDCFVVEDDFVTDLYCCMECAERDKPGLGDYRRYEYTEEEVPGYVKDPICKWCGSNLEETNPPCEACGEDKPIVDEDWGVCQDCLDSEE